MRLELYDALGQQKVSNAAPEYVMGEELAFNEWPGADGYPAASTTLATITITGDGVNPTQVEGHALLQTSAGGATFALEIWEGGVRQTHDRHDMPNAGQFGVVHSSKRIPPFMGTKTFTLSCTGTTHVNRSYGILPYLRATRLKSAPQFYPPQAMVYNPLVSGSAQLAHASEAIITWQNAEYDTHGMWAAGSPTRLTAKMAGLHEIQLTAWIAAGGPANQIVYAAIKRTLASTGAVIYYYGSTPLTAGTVNPGVGNIAQAIETIPLNPGDYVEAAFYQWNASSATKGFQTGLNGCRMRMKWDGPSVINAWDQTDTGWIALPALQNGATLYSSGDTNFLARYRRKNGIVYCRGLLGIPGALVSDSLLFTLPAGFRPSIEHHFPTIHNNAFNGIGIQTGGAVKTKAAITAACWYSLDALQFVADQ